MKDLLHIQEKSYAFVLNFQSEAINIDTLTSRGRAVRNRRVVFLYHFTPRNLRLHNLRLLLGTSFPPLNKLYFFFNVGQYQNAGTAKKEKPQTIPKAVVVLKN